VSLPSENLHVSGESYAREFNAYDQLASFRDRFCIQPGTIYLDGNSLGLLSRDAEAALLGALEDWKRLGIAGWLQAEPAWFSLGEELGARVVASCAERVCSSVGSAEA